MIDAGLYMHESDKAAFEALKAIPGFSAFTRAFMKGWNEQVFEIMNMSSRLKLGENQMPKYYAMLKPICEKLGIAVPELYVELNVNPNSYTYGDTHPFIVITSGLFDTMPDELIGTVLAHECGHIACHHTLYQTMGRMIASGALTAMEGVLSTLVSVPLKMGFAYWMRCAEFSADRAAVIVDGSADKMIEVCMRLAGYDKNIHDQASIEAFMDQAVEYKKMIQKSVWNKTLEFFVMNQMSHPLTAVRAYECREWGNSDTFHKIMELDETGASSLHGEREIPMKESSMYYLSRKYPEVVKELENLGFTNVKAEPTAKKVLLTSEGDVMSITVNGKTGFKKDEWIRADAEIIVYCHAA